MKIRRKFEGHFAMKVIDGNSLVIYRWWVALVNIHRPKETHSHSLRNQFLFENFFNIIYTICISSLNLKFSFKSPVNPLPFQWTEQTWHFNKKKKVCVKMLQENCPFEGEVWSYPLKVKSWFCLQNSWENLRKRFVQMLIWRLGRIKSMTVRA